MIYNNNPWSTDRSMQNVIQKSNVGKFIITTAILSTESCI